MRMDVLDSQNTMSFPPWNKTSVDLVKNQECVVTWSGGIDSTGLLAYAVMELECDVYPIFVNRGQMNYLNEKNSVQHYTGEYKKLFGGKFNDPFEVSSNIPAPQFKARFNNNEKIYALRNSDLLNQAVRYALVLEISVILVGSLPEDVGMYDNSMAYWRQKIEEVRRGTNNFDIIIFPVFAHHEVSFSKSSVIKWCNENSLDLSNTWSCFNAGISPCKSCGACKAREQAFEDAKES